MQSHRSISLVLLACVLGAGVIGCGSSAPSTTKTASSAPATTASSSAASSAAAAVAANWVAFFNAKTPVAKRASLLQNGSQFAAIIKSQAGSSLASQASAKVTKVTILSATQAKVTYNILVSGAAALSNQSGTAIYQGGTWKVGDSSFCGLLALENGGSTKNLPAACSAAS